MDACNPSYPRGWGRKRELIELGRRRLQWAQIVSLYFSLGDRAKPLKKEEEEEDNICKISGTVYSISRSCFTGLVNNKDAIHTWNYGRKENTKISWARWRVPVIPATQEAETGELPEPRRRRLWWAKIAPLHSSLGNKSETLSQKKKKAVNSEW